MNAKTRKPARKAPDGTKAEKNIYKRGEYSYQVKMMIGSHPISETFDTLPEARAFRDSKKAASVLDPDFKRVLESRIKKTEAASSNLGCRSHVHEEKRGLRKIQNRQIEAIPSRIAEHLHDHRR